MLQVNFRANQICTYVVIYVLVYMFSIQFFLQLYWLYSPNALQMYKWFTCSASIVQKNKQKKRAEKNRQLGVKRLKLQTVLKPKPVTYCRHYLKGRCYEVILFLISFLFDIYTVFKISLEFQLKLVLETLIIW